MPKYKVYFEIYGKKMCSVVEASDENEAKKTIRWKIRFDKIEKIEEPKADNPLGDIMSAFDQMGIKL